MTKRFKALFGGAETEKLRGELAGEREKVERLKETLDSVSDHLVSIDEKHDEAECEDCTKRFRNLIKELDEANAALSSGEADNEKGNEE